MAKKDKNWGIVKNQKMSETLRYRDVYEDQQLERTSVAEKQTMTSRAIICAILALFAFLIVWIIASAVQYFNFHPSIEGSINPRGKWVHVNEYYVNKEDETDKISVEEYGQLKANYNPNYPKVKDPGEPPSDTLPNPIWEVNHYEVDLGNGVVKMSGDMWEEYKANFEKEYRKKYNSWLEKKKAYEDYVKATTNPDDTYMYQKSHYRNISNTSEYVLEEKYEELVAEFDAKLASGELGEAGEVPYQPLNPASLYKEDEMGERTFDDPSKIYHPVDEDGNEIIIRTEEEEIEISDELRELSEMEEESGSDETDEVDETDDATSDESEEFEDDEDEPKEIVAYMDKSGNKISIDKYNALVSQYEDYLEDSEQMYPITYRNKLDGSVISYKAYEKLVTEYENAIAQYKVDYMAHRDKYHDGTEMDPKEFDMSPTSTKFLWSIAIGGLVFALLYAVMKRNLTAQNALSDTSDINQYHNDQHVALPQEIMETYDYFPDVGAHSSISASGILAHIAIKPKGLKNIDLADRYKKDVKDENDVIIHYKKEIVEDDNGAPVTKSVPIIDTDFMEALYKASLEQIGKGDEDVRVYYDMTKVPYNPDGGNREKLAPKGDMKDKYPHGYATVADLINADWEFPIYEPQRPGGAYIVDTAPVNTMVLAITRAGKGQTIIEPTIDIWTREKRPNNMVINDPKGELLVKNYVRMTVRGLQVVQFNLINAMKTDIYNPLAMAADAAREGDTTKCAMYIENIADVFFPTDKSDEPMWPTAANNAFKRAAYGLIDFYLEKEKDQRRTAARMGIDMETLEHQIDEMWGKVTLYNCYQLFVQLSSKKMKNPAVEFTQKAKNHEFDELSDEEFQKQLDAVKKKSALWEDKPDADLLTLYFAATDMLPRNTMRTLVANANNALKAMAGAEKMLASVYGIAITAMAFFTDPTISTLTSGTLSQNVDLASLSFPRRMGVRFNNEYMEKYHFVGQQAVWDAFEDETFTKPLDKSFHHEDMVTREGWARYYFDGKFKNEVGYVRLEIRNPRSGNLIRTFYFKFKKDYQKSLDGRVYMKDPILNEKVVKNGFLTELRKFKDKDGNFVYRPAKTTFKQNRILDVRNKGDLVEVNSPAIISTMCRYAEKAKAIFLVTPPHLMKYAKLILILIKQLVDLNFDKSYMTKANQKPLYKTRFMLDELGNLQSEGHGISGFETMLSIGLGQEQQFTLILQTLQQLKDVYGVKILSTNRVAAYM